MYCANSIAGFGVGIVGQTAAFMASRALGSCINEDAGKAAAIAGQAVGLHYSQSLPEGAADGYRLGAYTVAVIGSTLSPLWNNRGPSQGPILRNALLAGTIATFVATRFFGPVATLAAGSASAMFVATRGARTLA